MLTNKFENFNNIVEKSVEGSSNLTTYMKELENNTIDIKSIIDVDLTAILLIRQIYLL